MRKFDGTYELMTYDMYNQKEKLGEVKNRKYIIDIVRMWLEYDCVLWHVFLHLSAVRLILLLCV